MINFSGPSLMNENIKTHCSINYGRKKIFLVEALELISKLNENESIFWKIEIITISAFNWVPSLSRRRVPGKADAFCKSSLLFRMKQNALAYFWDKF
jgi:hypothetical protein